MLHHSRALLTLVAGADLATSSLIDFREHGSGVVHIVSGSGLTGLTWHSCSTETGTFLPLKTVAGAAVASVVAPSQSCPIPAECAGASFLKAVANAAGVMDVNLKS
jgi:hypothetical protein